jgi:ClpP class serine protease
VSGRIPDTIVRAFLSSHWAMTPDAVRKCYEIITRQGIGPEAVAAELGRKLDNTRHVTVRDGIAYIAAIGPMIRYASSFKAISGAASYEALARDLHESVNNAMVRAIVFDFDTPGGELSGCLDLGEQIHQANLRKPVYALVSGNCASAGYLLASATRRIIANPSSVVGSLGVCLSLEDDRAQQEMNGIRSIQIISSQTPFKNEDPLTKEGLDALQVLVDDLAVAYAAPIARYRGLASAEQVFEHYGAGRVVVAEKALAAGLIDGLAYTEDFHAELLEELASPAAPARAVGSIASAPAPQASLQQEPTMKFKKGAKVRVAAGSASVVADGTEGTVEEVRAGTGLYRVAFASGKHAWLAESQLAEPKAETPAASKEKPKAKAKAEGDETEEGEEEEEPAAEGEEGEEGEEEEEPAAEGDETEEGDEEEEEPAASATALAAKAERDRVLGIQALAMPGEEAVIDACIADSSCSVEAAALKLRQAQAKAPGDRLAARRAADKGKPRAGVLLTGPTDKKVSPKAARVIASIGRVFPGQKKEKQPAQG